MQHNSSMVLSSHLVTENSTPVTHSQTLERTLGAKVSRDTWCSAFFQDDSYQPRVAFYQQHHAMHKRHDEVGSTMGPKAAPPLGYRGQYY